MVSIFVRGCALQGETSTEVVSFLGTAVGTVPVIAVVYGSSDHVEAALVVMKLEDPRELIDEVAEKAVGLGAAEGILVNLGASLVIAELLNQQWPVGLDPVRDEVGEELLRFRICRHQGAPSKTPG